MSVRNVPAFSNSLGIYGKKTELMISRILVFILLVLMVSVNISSILFQEYNHFTLVLMFSSWGIFHTPSVSHPLIHL